MSGRQDELPGLGSSRGVPRGRAERSIDASARAARASAGIPGEHAGLVTLARQLARGMDVAERTGKVYAQPQLARALLDTYAALGWTGGSTGADPFDAFLSSLSEPEVSDTDDAGRP